MTDHVFIEMERRWFEAAAHALKRLRSDHRDGEIYAAAFWLLYADADSLLCPAFALNDEAAASQQDRSGRSVDVRWSPPDWRWSVVDEAVDSVRPLYVDARPGSWQTHVDMLSRVCKSITAHARAGTSGFDGVSVSKHFVCGIIDLAQGDHAVGLLKSSVAADVLDENPGLVEALSS